MYTLSQKLNKLLADRAGLDLSLSRNLQKSILQEAIQGKLVPQDPTDEPASILLERIREEKNRLVKEKKIKANKYDSIIFKGDDNKYYEQIEGNVIDISSELEFDIPNSWEWCRLRSIATSELGKTLDGGKNIGTSVPYLCSINVYWDKIDLSIVKKTLFTDMEKEKYSLKKGDLLICEGGDIGRTAIWDKEEKMYYQNALHRVRFSKGIMPQYFLYVLQYYKALGVLDKKSKGMTIKHFAQTALNNLYVPLPPLFEQQRIVAQIKRLFNQL
ncbi:restriction endonuclease S subunit [Parabacteroides sp. PFB2-12]|uniref:restriction endonuclease subunit S n=1 Tax=unclassified Parabacteroides TaxID=2649774 RepID=UPI00247649DA|nr:MULTISPECIES: restriction endonuclease subunit S [unclassified Parabacteroides]MDH6342473.1 restriction endonuclease S subunit [Parabacteroides sp. PM6-13]MDH6390125.1 restriction endonuclease S subunit [Parabacteroides sp. PFB2-12]